MKDITPRPSFAARLKRRLPPSRADLLEATKKIKDLARDVQVGRQEIGRLEGLLDVRGDPDENLTGDQRHGLYREISGDVSSQERDFSDEQRRKIIKLSQLAYALKGAAENLLDIHLDFMIGDELRPKVKLADGETKADRKKLQEALDELWGDPRNRLEDEVEDYSRALIHDGELHLSIEPSTIDGHLELGWIDPLEIPTVLQDKRRRDVWLMVNGPDPGQTLRYFVLGNLNDQLKIEPWPVDMKSAAGYKWIIREETIGPDGEGLLVRQEGAHGLSLSAFWNRPKGATRGRGELTSVLDNIDAQDELVWSSVDVQNKKRLFLLHLKDPGISTKAQARATLEKYGLKTPPRNPKVLATNNKVEIDFLEQQTSNTENWLAKELGIQTMGAKGFPSGWRGDYTEGAMSGVKAGEFLPLRRLRRKQKRLLRFWKRLIEIAFFFQRAAEIAIPEGAFEIVTLEVGGKDKQRGSEVLKAVAAALVQMASIDGAKPELLNHIFVTLIKELGINITEALEGLPPEAADAAKKIDDAVQQLLSQKGREDEDYVDEEDRERQEEEGATEGAA